MQTSQQPAQHYADDEISLIELWQMLVKRKALLLACLVISLAGGAAFAFLKAPVYEANVSLRIGTMKSDSERTPSVMLEDTGELVARALAQGDISKALVPKGSTTIVQLAASAHTPDAAASKLESAVQDILRAHKATFDQSLKPITDRIKTLDEERQTLNKQSADINALVDQLKQREPVQAALLVLQRASITSAINQLEVEHLRLTQLLAPPQTQATELLGKIATPNAPVQPKKELVIALAAVLGIFGGVMLALVAEFIAKRKANSAAETCPPRAKLSPPSPLR